MNWIVALVICFGQTCQPGWVPSDTFASKADCEMYSELYVKQAQILYPESQGQLFCIVEEALAEAKDMAVREGVILKPAPTLAMLNDFIAKNPPAPANPDAPK